MQVYRGSGERVVTGQGMAHLSAAAGAAVLRAARMAVAQVKYSNDLTIRIGELEGVRRGLSSITEAVVDVPSPQARGK